MSGSRIQCFWLEPTQLGRSSLRRYERHSFDPMPPPSCPKNRMKYHDTSVVLGDIPYPFGTADSDPTPEEISHDDPRWPQACDVCGTQFRDEDNWQHNVHRLYSGAPDGKLYSLRDAPPSPIGRCSSSSSLQWSSFRSRIGADRFRSVPSRRRRERQSPRRRPRRLNEALGPPPQIA
jgi:hypothetical protein